MVSTHAIFTRSMSGFVALLGALLLSGCVEPSRSSVMAAAPLTFAAKHTGSVSVIVTGGAASASIDASNILGTDFATAIDASLKQSQLFAQVLPVGQAEEFQLAAAIVRVEHPEVGRAMTSTIEVNWTLIRANNKYLLWKKTISSSATAKASEAFSGVDRMRLANEGAASKNIEDALTQISALKL